MKKIAFEEHFATEKQLNTYRSILEGKYRIPGVAQEETALDHELPFLYPSVRQGTVNQLYDLEEGRIKEMDAAGIDVQVLSLVSPGVQAMDASAGSSLSKEVNDTLSEVVKRNPRRFVGLASIAPQDPPEAANELERAIKKLGLRGATINSHTKGEYLDHKKYWVILERAEKLGVPIYLHPRVPSSNMVKPYLDYRGMETAVLGFAHEVSLHALRLIYSGVFDQYPKLNIVLGHMGEALPYWIWRIDNMWGRGNFPNKPKRLPSEYLRDNFFITTSGMFSQPPLLCAHLTLGADRILFAVDYPMESNGKAVQFIDTAPIANSDKEKICHLNAEKLLGL